MKKEHKDRAFEFEHVPCALCGSEEERQLYEVPTTVYGRKERIWYVKCVGCGLVRMNPRLPAEVLLALYSELRVCDFDAGGGAAESCYSTAQEPRRRLVEKYCRGGRLLDVGSGDGQFLHTMKKAGWEVEGIEIVESQAAYQREKLGLTVQTGTIETAEFQGRVFDVITLWALLEHVPDPLSVLRHAAESLSPDGTIIVSVPNIGSLEAFLFRRRWFGLCPPFHLFMFEPKTMKNISVRAGLSVERIIYASTATTLMKTVKNIKHGNYTFLPPIHAPDSGSESSPIKSVLKQLVFQMAVVPALKMIDVLHLGAGTIYILRK
ncbi:MAG: class I SAM-dependent methyltransferase [bacterium]